MGKKIEELIDRITKELKEIGYIINFGPLNELGRITKNNKLMIINENLSYIEKQYIFVHQYFEVFKNGNKETFNFLQDGRNTSDDKTITILKKYGGNHFEELYQKNGFKDRKK